MEHLPKVLNPIGAICKWLAIGLTDEQTVDGFEMK